MWSASFLPHMNHVSVSPTDGNGHTQGQRKTNLKEALGLSKEDLPLYIYRMRYHGYPPGYLPRAMKPSLNLYDGDGNIDNYVVEEESGVGDNICRSFIEYPGFNVPPPEGEFIVSAKTPWSSITIKYFLMIWSLCAHPKASIMKLKRCELHHHIMRQITILDYN